MRTIISIGTDGKILDSGRVYDRVREYASLVDGTYYCFVFTNNEKKVKYQKEDANFIVKAIYGKNKLQQIKSLFFEVRELKLSVGVNAIWYPQDSFEIGLISLVFKFLFSGKLYAQCHTDISHPNFRNLSKRNYLQYLIAQIVFRKADRIRVVSQRMKNYLVEGLGIDESKVLSLPIYFDGSISSPEGGGREGAVDFMIMSRIEKEKNIETAIEALASLSSGEGQRERVLKIVGSGTYKKVLEEKYLVEKYKFITWSDWTDNPIEEYKNAKYFLLPSFYEGWALTAVESVACGTPVVMTPVGCAHEFMQDYKNGIVSEGFDAKSFAEAIKKAIAADFSKENLSKTVLELDTKQQYLNKLQIFLN